MEGYMALMIPIMALSIPFFAMWIKHKEKMVDKQVGATAEASAEKAAQYASHIQRLEDRVQVLERIVTDGGYNVATQIEALRDARRIEQGVEDHSAGVPLGLGRKENV